MKKVTRKLSLWILGLAFMGIALLCDSTQVQAFQGSPDIVVVLDPGHDAKHGGTKNYGLYEHEIVFKIATYCKEELEKYAGVTVYMTRPTNTCPAAAGMNSTACNTFRVDYAQSVNADVYISFHLDSVESTKAKGASVFYPNSNYNAQIGAQGKELASSILDELTKLGIKKNGEGIKIRNSTDGTTYPDGSKADYLAVIKGAKLRGFPSVLIEHLFLSNPDEVNQFLKTEEQIKNIGIADATGIAKALGLTKHDVCQAADGNWYYYADGVVDTGYRGLAKNSNGWWYIENGQVNWGYTGLVYHHDSWFCVQNGAVAMDYTGLVSHNGTWYYVENGVLNWNYTGLTQYYDTWYYVENGVLNWGYTGLVYHYDTWYYVENGVLNWGYTGLVYHYGTWYYVGNGVLDWNYTGLTQYNGTWYYVENGALNWGYTGLAYYYGTWYYVENGALNWGYTGLVYHYGTWYYVGNGVLDWNYTGLAQYNGTWWYVENGIMVRAA